MRDVAMLAGVSTATVSHFINNSRRLTPETRARVEHAIATTGFVPNPAGRLLAQQKSHIRPVVSLPTAQRDHAEPGGSGNGHQNRSNPAVAAPFVPRALPNLSPGSAVSAPGNSTTRLL
ncbi:MAG TPA: LacI family DNA-binding transcriptional regulator, partial [Pyrinomonadaceae bacterium]|nr:LacI family DNA-binding transcriptional regulator [Pyrinomonadaceae bacterium]